MPDEGQTSASSVRLSSLSKVAEVVPHNSNGKGEPEGVK